MGKRYGRVAKALDAIGATLKRSRKHLVYELPDGRNFVIPNSPSDTRGELNALSTLRAMADVPEERRHKAPADVRSERRRRPGRAGQTEWGLPAEREPFAMALRESGVVEQQLRTRVGQLEATLTEREAQIANLESLWTVRLWRAWNRVWRRDA